MAKKKSGKKASEPWRNRIVGHGQESPEQLLANPDNWRIHPSLQQDALSQVLEQVGVVQSVIVNRVTGHVVDGHLRISLAISRGEASIPVTYVELSQAEEALVLATFDPISGLAATDQAKLTELIQLIPDSDAAVAKLLHQERPKRKVSFEATRRYRIVIDCESEVQQGELVDRLTSEGYTCRAD